MHTSCFCLLVVFMHTGSFQCSKAQAKCRILDTTRMVVLVSDKTISFQELAQANAIYKTLMAFATFLVTLGLLYILRYNRTISILGATIQDSKGRLAAFGLFCVAFLLAFASLTHVWFGAKMYDFRAVYPAMVRLAIRHMDMSYEETREVAGLFGAVVMFVFCFATLIIIMNFVITLINDSLENLQFSKDQPPDHEVVEYMFSLFRSNKVKPGECAPAAELWVKSLHY